MPKLVRDKIPEFISSDGGMPKWSTVSGPAFLEALAYKLDEESGELQTELFNESQGSGDRTKIVMEFADLLEVMHAVADHLGMDWIDIDTFRQVRRDERGGFEQGIYLED